MSPPRTRSRTLLACVLVVSVLFAGCVSDAGTAPTNTTTDPVESVTDATVTTTLPGTEYPDTTFDFEEGPKERPDRPATLSESSARQFVKEYEYRHVYNLLWMGERTDVSLSCETHWVEERRDGYEVLVSCTGSADSGGDAVGNGTATSTMVHADWFTQWYVYYVDDDSVVRRRATEDEREGAG